MSDVSHSAHPASHLPHPKTYEIPTFLGRPPIPVELVAELQSYELRDGAVILRCATNRYLPTMHDHYGTPVETVFKPPTPGAPVSIRLDFCTDAILRVRCCPGPEVPDHPTPMVVGAFEPVRAQVSEDAQAVTLQTQALRVRVVREPWQIEVYDRAGALLWATRPVDIAPLRRPAEQWNPPQQRWIFLHRYAYPLGMAHHGERQYVFLSFDLRHDEHIYGFGESYGRLDKRETQQTLWIQEALSNASPAAYKRAPFFMSTRGYGLFVNTSNATRVNVGSLDHTAISVIVDDTDLLDFYLIYGPTLRDILPRYTAITGAPAVPPKWSFGLWMSRLSYNQQSQVEAVAAQLREHRIPCDVIHIDTDWYENPWECDLRFGPSRFPDPAGMIQRLRAQGFRVSLWQWPNMVLTSPMFDEARRLGFLARRPNGKPYLFAGFEIDAGLIDYSNPEAVAWIQEKFRALFKLGVAAIKADFGEGAPPDAVYHGVASESMHSLYPLLYNQALFEVTRAFWGRGLIWARSAWAGSQRYPVHWSGDGIARFDDLACVLRAALSFGLSGFPFYSHDIGGFSGLPSPELYARWAQLGLFSSHARAHGAPPREPWEYGETAERIFRQYADLRYRLMPYLYSEAVECGRDSTPMLRALVLDFQDDPNTFTLDDQYLFGRWLLVAPILDETNRRRVYLPAGEWVDFWTKAVIAGGRWLNIEAPLDVLPMYVRAGAILPFGPAMQYVDEKPLDPLTLEIYRPGQAGEYVIHDEDRPDIRVSYRREGNDLVIATDAAPGQIEVIVYGSGEYGSGESRPITARWDGTGAAPQTTRIAL